MKRSATDHPKLEDLADAIAKTYKHHARFARVLATGVMERLWHFTAKFTPQGDIGRRTNEQIGRFIGWPKGEEDTLIDLLLQTNWLQSDSYHRLIVNDWASHADDSVKRALKRHDLSFACQDMSGLPVARAYSQKPEPVAQQQSDPAASSPPAPVPSMHSPIHRPGKNGAAISKLGPAIPVPMLGGNPDAVVAAVESIIDAHPHHRRGKRTLAETQIADITAGDLGRIRALATRHGEWCAYWAHQPPRFTPSLAAWLGDGSWRDPPPERVEESAAPDPWEIAKLEEELLAEETGKFGKAEAERRQIQRSLERHKRNGGER